MAAPVRAALNPADRPVWPGTIGPSAGSPPRPPGSVRRTSTIDILFPEQLAAVTLRGRARDLLTCSPEADRVLAQASAGVRVELSGRLVTSIEVEPAEWREAAQSLVGVSSGSRFRRALDECLPEQVANGSLLCLLLDEVPVATLIAGSSIARRGFLPNGAQVRRLPLIDVCAGWMAEGEMVAAIERGEQPFLGEGPPAGSLDNPDDPQAWHDLPDLPPGSMRRRRRLDLLPLQQAGDGFDADVLFRDSYIEPDGRETVVHEYGITATIDAIGVVMAIEATPHALPGPDCPIAAASAQRLVGMALADVRRHVRESFTGTSTCTHLNDALRSLGDLAHLRPIISRGPAGA